MCIYEHRTTTKDIIALTRPAAMPMAAEAKNMRQNLPTAIKKAAAPLTWAMAGLDSSNTVLYIQGKQIRRQDNHDRRHKKGRSSLNPPLHTQMERRVTVHAY